MTSNTCQQIKLIFKFLLTRGLKALKIHKYRRFIIYIETLTNLGHKFWNCFYSIRLMERLIIRVSCGRKRLMNVQTATLFFPTMVITLFNISTKLQAIWYDILLVGLYTHNVPFIILRYHNHIWFQNTVLLISFEKLITVDKFLQWFITLEQHVMPTEQC